MYGVGDTPSTVLTTRAPTMPRKQRIYNSHLGQSKDNNKREPPRPKHRMLCCQLVHDSQGSTPHVHPTWERRLKAVLLKINNQQLNQDL